MAVKLFVDFDGTVTTNDVGNAFFEEFGGKHCATLVEQYRNEKISAKELFRKEVAALGVLDVRQAKEFLCRQPIDETFKNLLAYCRSQHIELHIVSDGLDFYMNEILHHNGIADVSFFANHFEVTPDGHSSISFPFDDAECRRCACCKRNIMLSKCGEKDIIMYVGEGYSDRCPAEYADFIFAKDDLQRFCQQKNISYFSYSSFDDVEQRLRALLARTRIKPRREAEMKRREIFISEP